MKTISALVIVVGLGLAPAGCVFQPDMGDGPQCDRDADCAEYGDCACVGGKCVPAYSGAGCGYQRDCEAPELLCGDACVDVETHPDHCGRCDHPCDSPPAPGCEVNADGDEVAVTYLPAGLCVAGDCQYESSDQVCPYGCAGGECLEPCLAGDCDPGEVCVEGRCSCGGDGPDCTPAQLCCDSECVEPATDDANCGHCGVDCTNPPPPVCIDAETLKVKTAGPCVLGACQFSEGFTQCPSGCQDDRCVSDPCGGPCDNPPPARCVGNELIEPEPVGECVNEVCEFADGLITPCDFGCDENAAACLPECISDADCAPGETCVDNECLCGANPACTADQACCGGGCVMSNDDPNHCGGCYKPCHLGLPNVWSAECTNGSCDYMCDMGMADCNQDLTDGCETDTLQDPGNCGWCGTLCGVDSCVEGGCLPNADDSNVQCGPGVLCGPGTFCCVGVDNQWCSDNGTVSSCDAGHVLLCDDTSDCPDGTVCCFDLDSLGTACVNEGGCMSGWVTCDAGVCADGTTCNTIDLNNTASLDLCQPR